MKWLVALFVLFAAPAVAQVPTYVDMATVSKSTVLTAGRLCATDGRDIYCDASLPMATGGLGLGDRITSGTSVMAINSLTGIVSLTQAGSTWAYLHPTLGLVAPGVSTTGPISASGLYVRGNATVEAGNLSFNSTYRVAWGSSYLTGDHNVKFLALATSGTEVVRITSTGLVGIGTTTPSNGVVDISTTTWGLAIGTESTRLKLNQNQLQSVGGPLYINASNLLTTLIGVGGGTLGVNLSNGSAPSATFQVSGTAFMGANQPAIYTSITPTLVIGQRPGDGFAALTLNPSSNTAIGYSFYTNGSGSYGLYAHAAGTYPMVARGGNVGINMATFGTTPSASLHVSGTVLTTSWTGINFSPLANVTPTAPLEVSGTVSATGIQLAMASTTTPPPSQCANSADYGRMMRGGDGRFYLCVER